MRLRLLCLVPLLAGVAACGGGGPKACTPTVTCASAACGTPDGCGGTCGLGGLPCAAGATRVEGGVTLGAARASGPGHQVQGALVPGAATDLTGPGHTVEQATLR